jgi:hypothetical protein
MLAWETEPLPNLVRRTLITVVKEVQALECMHKKIIGYLLRPLSSILSQISLFYHSFDASQQSYPIPPHAQHPHAYPIPHMLAEMDENGEPNWRNIWVNELGKLQSATAEHDRMGVGHDEWYRMMTDRVRAAFAVQHPAHMGVGGVVGGVPGMVGVTGLSVGELGVGMGVGVPEGMGGEGEGDA